MYDVQIVDISVLKIIISNSCGVLRTLALNSPAAVTSPSFLLNWGRLQSLDLLSSQASIRSRLFDLESN